MRLLLLLLILLTGCRHQYKIVLDNKQCPENEHVHGVSISTIDQKHRTIHVQQYSYYCSTCTDCE